MDDSTLEKDHRGAVTHGALSERWRPVRAGLLNIYRFDEEVFQFHNGRLLVRGNNGTGKTRILALLLPFLFDGDVSSHRVEPDADPSRRIEWHLLMGKYEERLGYTWLELGRRDESGSERIFTLGCALHAVEGKGLTGKWFFITTRRIGRELSLTGSSGQPLTKDRLITALGESGQVFTTANAYRQAIDAALFKLGEHRYGALVNLLIQLRQPQLSRHLDERRLSDALSEALPPISSSIIGDIAEAFRGLEADRRTLESFVSADSAVDSFLKEYRRYVQIATRRRADRVRSTHAAYESYLRDQRTAETRRENAEAALTESTEKLMKTALEKASAEAAVHALENSEAMRDARSLDASRLAVTDRENEAAAARADFENANANRKKREENCKRAEDHATRTRTEVAQAFDNALRAAEMCGLDGRHRAELSAIGLPDLSAEGLSVFDRAEGALDTAAEERHRGVRHVQKLSDKARQAEKDLGQAKERHDELTIRLDEATEVQRQAKEGHARAIEQVKENYRSWSDNLVELNPAEPDELSDAMESWALRCEGPSPVRRAVEAAEAAAIRVFEGKRATLERSAEDERTILEKLENEREALAAGRHEPPPPPHTREARRDTKEGAPLWRLCDFATDIPEASRAGLEAALEASGLLDAWVMPDGRLIDPGEQDTIVAPGLHPPPEKGHLGMVLQPLLDRNDDRVSGITEAAVAAILCHIGLGENAGFAWVDASGNWQLGPLKGRWAKPRAEHIGETAREARRLERLKVIERDVASSRTRLDAINAELTLLVRREDTARSEAAMAPTDSTVTRALAELESAVRAVAKWRDAVSEAEAKVAERRRALGLAIAERDTAAADLGIAQWLEDLAGLEDRLGDYRRLLSRLGANVRVHATRFQQAASALRDVQEARDEEKRRALGTASAETKAAAAAAEYRTLEAIVGVAAKDIVARLETERERVKSLERNIKELGERGKKVEIDLAVIANELSNATTALQRAIADREEAIQRLRRFAALGLLTVAVEEISGKDSDDWSITRAVEIARRLESVLSAIPSEDSAWERFERTIHAHIQTLTGTLLPEGYSPSATLEDGIFVVTVPFQGRTCSVAQLKTALVEEISSRKTILSAREREILENHLIGEVSLHLHELLHEGEKLIRGMNDELEARPMSTGMKLRFDWKLADDGPAGLSEARRLLFRAGGTWSTAERQALGAFLQERIHDVRAARETGSWQEHLTEALDYRAWHRFVVERQQDGKWKLLTRKTHGTGSGGEKAVALTMPQFAAASAHYRTADPLAPRLILLDEAFVGVDDDMRAKCMGLLETFDLDFIMTSEREWGCYPTISGLAIYQLAARAGIDAIGLTRWVWDGRQRVRLDSSSGSDGPLLESANESLGMN